jgi:hypothetical protein
MATSSDTITASFPVSDLTPLATGTNEPTYQSIRIARTQLNSNAASIFSASGGGLHGHLALTMTAAEHLAVVGANNAFQVPPNPGTLVHPINATAPQISEAVRLHKDALATFQLYHNVDKALRNQLIKATPEVFIQATKDPILGFGRCTCLTILTHLRTTYGEITPDELDRNLERMSAAWHPPTPIEDLFEQLRAGAEFATEGGDTPSTPQMVRLGYNLIYKTGLFSQACREWRDKPAADKTFNNLKLHFKKWDKDRKLLATSSSAGYHGANHASSNVPSSDSQATLTQLQQQIQALTSALANASTSAPNNSLPSALQATSNASSSNNSTLTPPTGAATTTAPVSYCWSHGSSRNRRHTSATCLHPREGHQATATLENKLGGSERVYTEADRRVPR